MLRFRLITLLITLPLTRTAQDASDGNDGHDEEDEGTVVVSEGYEGSFQTRGGVSARGSFGERR